MQDCPCGSGQEYQTCCGKIHESHQEAKTAEQLMRARYSAFVINKVEFVDATNVPGTTDFSLDEAKEWATSSTWDHLEVIKTQAGQEQDEKGIVEFKAFYKDLNDKDIIHHEIGHFKKEDGKWFYTEGQIVGLGPLKRETPKVGRNEPCPCGSGKKFKKCCGKN